MCEPDLSTLPQRMRYASGVLAMANLQFEQSVGCKYGGFWTSDSLLKRAKTIEDDARETAERQKYVGELARDVAKARGCTADWEVLDALTQLECLGQAERLIDAGWHKGELV